MTTYGDYVAIEKLLARLDEIAVALDRLNNTLGRLALIEQRRLALDKIRTDEVVGHNVPDNATLDEIAGQ